VGRLEPLVISGGPGDMYRTGRTDGSDPCPRAVLDKSHIHPASSTHRLVIEVTYDL